MAKPIEGNPVLQGKDAENFRAYLARAKSDPEKKKRHEAYRAKVRALTVVK